MPELVTEHSKREGVGYSRLEQEKSQLLSTRCKTKALRHLSVSGLFLQAHWDLVEIVGPDMKSDDSESFDLQVFEFFLCVDDVSATLATDVDTVDWLTSPELVAPGADLSVDATCAKVGFPEAIRKIAADDWFSTLHAVHSENGIRTVRAVPELTQSGILSSCLEEDSVETHVTTAAMRGSELQSHDLPRVVARESTACGR
jgi:hypothetical protein